VNPLLLLLLLLFAVAERTKLTIDGVEFLLMKALALHLIEGSIDQVRWWAHHITAQHCQCMKWWVFFWCNTVAMGWSQSDDWIYVLCWWAALISSKLPC
jgi:hypothetical protein